MTVIAMMGVFIEFYLLILLIVITIGLLVFLSLIRYLFNYPSVKTIYIISFFPIISAISLYIIGHIIGELHYQIMERPMTVQKHHIEGDYVINKKLFSGKNADWQYEHYTLSIDEDTLYLNVLNNNKLIKKYKTPIFYIVRGKHQFIEFYDDWEIRFATYDEEDKINLDYIAEKYKDSLHLDQALKEEMIQKETFHTLRILRDSIYQAKRDSAIHYINHHMLTKNPLLHADPFNFNLVLQSTKYGNMFFTKGTLQGNRNILMRIFGIGKTGCQECPVDD